MLFNSREAAANASKHGRFIQVHITTSCQGRNGRYIAERVKATAVACISPPAPAPVKCAQSCNEMKQQHPFGGFPSCTVDALVQAEVQSLHHDGSVVLHTRSLKYGKLTGGQLVAVPANLVKRQKQHFRTLESLGKT